MAYYLTIFLIQFHREVDTSMADHALRTALTLYEGGTLDLETAASHAGVSPSRLRQRAAEATVRVPAGERVETPERLRVAGD